jgi:acetyltransferase-like isoleucine patch superfamily enzyme
MTPATARAAYFALNHRWARRYAERRGLEVGDKVQFIGRPIISRAPESSISLGARVVVCSSARGTPLGVNHPVILRTMLPGAVLSIGEDVGLSGTSICAAREVRIGNGCLVGANVTIADTDFHPVISERRRYQPIPEPKPEDRVLIGDNVFLGTGAIVLKGATIEDDAVIGAGVVVRSHVPRGARLVPSAPRLLLPDE